MFPGVIVAPEKLFFFEVGQIQNFSQVLEYVESIGVSYKNASAS